jgi:hypothetical protein
MRHRAAQRLAAFLLPLVGCSSSNEGVTGDAGAEACGSCHTTELAAWSTSPLASSGTSPVFTALAERAATAWGADARARCQACHEPGIGGDSAIGCVACHAATGNVAPRDGLLTTDLDQPLAGPFADAAPTPAHGSRVYGFLESPDLCGTCHEVTGPDLFHETTLDELEASPAANSGAGCVGCHMPPVAPGPIAPGGPEARPRADHAFVGIDPPFGASADVAAASAARTLALLRAGIQLTMTRATAGGGFDVTVTNEAGHAVPTGIAFIRGVWVDVVLTGARGAPVTLPSVIALGSRPTSNGEPVALVTEADAVESRVLAPGGSLTAHVDVPSSLAGPVTARATLSARAVRPEVLSALGLDAVADEVPTHEVAIVVVR